MTLTKMSQHKIVKWDSEHAKNTLSPISNTGSLFFNWNSDILSAVFGCEGDDAFHLEKIEVSEFGLLSFFFILVILSEEKKVIPEVPFCPSRSLDFWETLVHCEMQSHVHTAKYRQRAAKCWWFHKIVFFPALIPSKKSNYSPFASNILVFFCLCRELNVKQPN